jgi:hypothetical protein
VWLLIASYLLLVFILPLALSAAVSYRTMGTGPSCSQCGGETFHVLAPVLRRLGTLLPRLAMQRRWCPGCGWEGLVRRGPEQTVAPAGPRPYGDAAATGRLPLERDAGASGVPPNASTQTLDVRSLTLNGTAWRVMLQCWHGTELCFGRFVFVAPSGRLWLDSMEALSGTTEDDVLGQALALPDVMLTRRLRRLVVDY